MAWRSSSFGQLLASHVGEGSQPLVILGAGRGVGPAEERHVEVVQQAGDRFIRLDHEHLDQRVRVAVVLGHGVDHLAVGVQHQLRLGHVQVDLPGLDPAGLDPLGQRVHLEQQLDHDRVVILDRALALGVGDDRGLVEDGLGLQVAESRPAVDDGVGELGADRLGVPVVADERALAEPGDALLQRADAVAQHLGQHRDDRAGEVAAVAAGHRLQVQRAAGGHEVAHVGDVDAQLPLVVGQLAEADRVVVVLGVVGVDRADDLVGQVDADGLLLVSVERIQGVAGLVLHLLREVAGQVELDDDRLEVDVLLAGGTQHVGDDAGRLALVGAVGVVSGVAGELDDDLGPRPDVPAGGVGGEDRLGQRVAVRQDDPLPGHGGQGADEALLAAGDHLGDLAAEHGLAVALAAVGDGAADDVAGHRPAVLALGDVQVLVAGRVGRHQEAEAPLVVPVGAEDLAVGRLRGGQHDRPLGAEHDPPGAHQLFQGVAEGVEVLVGVGDLKVVGQPARPLGAVVGGLQVVNDLGVQGFGRMGVGHGSRSARVDRAAAPGLGVQVGSRAGPTGPSDSDPINGRKGGGGGKSRRANGRNGRAAFCPVGPARFMHPPGMLADGCARV